MKHTFLRTPSAVLCMLLILLFTAGCGNNNRTQLPTLSIPITMSQIAFDANGGLFDEGDISVIIINALEGVIRPYQVPDFPIREGYRFDGWYAFRPGDNPGGSLRGRSLSNDFLSLSTSKSTYYAGWTKDAPLLQVAFDANGGIWLNGVTVITINSDLDGKIYQEDIPTEPTKEGYNFEGWYSWSGGTGMQVLTGSFMGFSGNTTVYAKWTKDAIISE
jgi:uncharacterized repeat protein (TIGR02543 family)